jgi:hypothetical protein
MKQWNGRKDSREDAKNTKEGEVSFELKFGGFAPLRDNLSGKAHVRFMKMRREVCENETCGFEKAVDMQEKNHAKTQSTPRKRKDLLN